MTTSRILTDKDREIYKPIIEEMWKLCPDMMGRKILEANVQQAFVFDMVTKTAFILSPTLCVGSFDDTACASLKELGYNIIDIDPALNSDLHSFAKSSNQVFDIVFATSVLEHVEDDEEFMIDMCSLLSLGGVGVLTMDFKDDYRYGDPLPSTDVRFYTKKRLEWLRSIIEMKGCEMVDEPDWTGKDNFIYQGHHYSFATFVFRKKFNV